MKNIKIIITTTQVGNLSEIFVNNILYAPLYFSVEEVKLSNNKNYSLSLKKDINYEFNVRVEGIYKCSVHSFIVLDLGEIKVYSLLTENLKGLKEGMWIKGSGIFELDFHYWIFDMDETVQPGMPPNIFYQYKINSIQKVRTKYTSYNIVEYQEYIEFTDEGGAFILDIDLQKLNPELYPSIAGGIEFHMKYLKPDWYNEEI